MRAPTSAAAATATLGLLLTALAAGPGGAHHDPAVHSVVQGPCEEQFVAYPMAMAEAQALAPPGFPPLPFDAAGFLPPNPLLATVVTVGFRCAGTTGTGGFTLGEVRTIGRVLVVDPPAHLKTPDIHNYVIVFGGWTSSEAMGEVYRSWHLPGVEVGNVSFNVTRAGDLRVGDAAAESAAGWLLLSTTVTGVEEPQQPDTFRLFVFDQGALAGYIDWAWPAGARTIESGAALQVMRVPAVSEVTRYDAGVAFHYWGAYEYHITYHPLR